jgi:isohexenylglutaconyl-CoA hydratase
MSEQSAFPVTQTLILAVHEGVLGVTFNRADRRNALSPRMVDEIIDVLTVASRDESLRAIVLRGAGASFCAGADIKEMAAARGAGAGGDPMQAVARSNRRFGDLCTAVQQARQPVIAVVEGAVLGGGIGIVCASDIALAMHDARFGLPETGLGLIPAQIAPFVVQRIGLTQARRLMLTGARFDGSEAQRIGLVHEVHADTAALDASVEVTLAQIRRCAPRANAATKRLVLESLSGDLPGVLDHAAQVFAQASVGDEAREGTLAFVEKRLPSWAK